MITAHPVCPRIREAISWSYEVKYGTSGLEETVYKGEGFKPISVFLDESKLGTFLVSAQGRFNAGIGVRLIISAWVSVPIRYEFNDDLKKLGMRLHWFLRRLIHRKHQRFFREKRNGAA